MHCRGGVSFLLLAWLALAQPSPKPQVIENRMVWARAPHNAYTDLARFRDRWFLVFREGSQVAGADGALRVLTSSDGVAWSPMAELTVPEADVRAPAISVAPDDRLVLTAAIRRAGSPPHTALWYSFDGREWHGPEPAGAAGEVFGRFAWYRGLGYAMAYDPNAADTLRLYAAGTPNLNMSVHSTAIPVAGQPADSAVLFEQDGSALCLLNREGATALMGKSRSPFKGWTWKPLPQTIAGPSLVRLPDGRIVAAGRLVGDTVRTSLFWVKPEENSVSEFFALPSGGDTGSPALAFHDGVLWVSYYSSHEGRASIYLAKLRLPPIAETVKPQRLTFGK